MALCSIVCSACGVALAFGAHDTLLSVTPLSFDISLLELFLPIVFRCEAHTTGSGNSHQPTCG